MHKAGQEQERMERLKFISLLALYSQVKLSRGLRFTPLNN